jgi:hypothetical protein
MKFLCPIGIAVSLMGVPCYSSSTDNITFGIWQVQMMPGPESQPGRQQCTPESKKVLEAQIDGWKWLKGLSRSEGEVLCGLVEKADDLEKLDGKTIEQLVPEKTRELLKTLGVDFSRMDLKAFLKQLGYDLPSIDIRAMKAQCRQAQGELDRLATSEIGRLRNELLVCEDSI